MEDGGWLRARCFGGLSSVVGHPQQMNAEQTVGPDRERRPAGAARQRAEGLERIFVAVLGVDGLAGAEFDHCAAHRDLLALACWRDASRCGGARRL